jgi:hypothetical protein
MIVILENMNSSAHRYKIRLLTLPIQAAPLPSFLIEPAHLQQCVKYGLRALTSQH